MKKCFLLLAAGLIAGVANGQQAVKSVVFNQGPQNMVAPKGGHTAIDLNTGHVTSPTVAHKTTSPYAGRWYNYAKMVVPNITSAAGYCEDVASTSYTGIDLWNDTTADFGYTMPSTSYSYNEWVSLGFVLEPWASIWNDNGIFGGGGFVEVGIHDSYVVDSVAVTATYSRNLSPGPKSAVVDSVRFAIVHGTGATSGTDLLANNVPGGTEYCTAPSANLPFYDMAHDSLTNSTTGTTLEYAAFPLTAADTSETYYHNYAYALPTPYSVPAGSAVGLSVSYKSMDATYHVGVGAGVVGDTVQYTTGANKFNSFNVEVDYNGTSATSIQYASYNSGDLNSGYFKREGANDNNGWGDSGAGGIGSYIPMWAFFTTSGASGLQYPNLWFHLTCASCDSVGSGHPLGVSNNVINKNSIVAYPNPADNELKISFSINQNTATKVTLTDMLGQVVATENFTNTKSGMAVFNTANLSSGLYIYTVQANGERATGHVSIAH